MKPLNHSDRKRGQLIFTLYFGLLILFLFVLSVFTLITAQKGITLLEKKQNDYNAVFRKQAEIGFQLDEMIKQLYSLKNKKRTLGEHKHLQNLITKDRFSIEEDIQNSKEGSDVYEIYKVLLQEIETTQKVLDLHKQEYDERNYNKEQLEKCRSKYEKLSGRRNTERHDNK